VRPYLEEKSHKRAGGVAQGVVPEFKPQYLKNKQKQKNLLIMIEYKATVLLPDDIISNIYK
jgi:hypothetical protein